MALTTTYFKRQPGPWTSNCTSKYPPSKGALAIGENITYSLSVCKNLCILNYIFEECNCIDPLLIEASSADFDDFEGLAFCSLIPANPDRICAGNATINFGKSSNCHCQPACDAVHYEVSFQNTKVLELNNFQNIHLTYFENLTLNIFSFTFFLSF